MIVNRGRYKLVSEPTACRKPLTTPRSMLSLDFEKTTLLTMFGLRAHIVITTVISMGLGSFLLLTYALEFYLLTLAGKFY